MTDLDESTSTFLPPPASRLAVKRGGHLYGWLEKHGKGRVLDDEDGL
ncbi:MAG: hypothetical protein JXP73_21305 [Deltaproteobacteria bacterium]|jgi:hypothetical protein|nr:hypothetical protein [Deltaproteobacteria bacterium]